LVRGSDFSDFDMTSTPDPAVLRSTLIWVLSTFAKVEWQLTLPFCAGELYCQWFDDVYHPDSEVWQSAFSDDEQLALANFTATLNHHSDSVEMWNKEWHEIVASANKALSAMAP
jgi:hypothetical protein